MQIKTGAAAHNILVGIDKGSDTVQEQGYITHETGLHGGIDDDFGPVYFRALGKEFPERHYFSMIKFIFVRSPGVHSPAPADNPTLMDHDASYRELAVSQGFAGFSQGLLHEIFMDCHYLF